MTRDYQSTPGSRLESARAGGQSCVLSTVTAAFESFASVVRVIYIHLLRVLLIVISSAVEVCDERQGVMALRLWLCWTSLMCGLTDFRIGPMLLRGRCHDLGRTLRVVGVFRWKSAQILLLL